MSDQNTIHALHAFPEIQVGIEMEDIDAKDPDSKDSIFEDSFPEKEKETDEMVHLDLPVSNIVGGILVDKRRTLKCGKYKIVYNSNCWAWVISVILILTLLGTFTKGIAELGTPNLSQFTVKYQPHTALDPKFCQNVQYMTFEKENYTNEDYGCTYTDETNKVSKPDGKVVQMSDPPPMSHIYQTYEDLKGPLGFYIMLYEGKLGGEQSSCEGYKVTLENGMEDYDPNFVWADKTQYAVDTMFNLDLDKDGCMFSLSVENVQALMSDNTKFEYMAYTTSAYQSLVGSLRIKNTIDHLVLPESMYLETVAPRINEKWNLFAFDQPWKTTQTKSHWINKLCSQSAGSTRKCPDTNQYVYLGMSKHSFNSPSLVNILDFTGIISRFWQETEWMYWQFSITYDQLLIQEQHLEVDIDQLYITFIMADMVKTEVSYQSISDLLEKLGGLYGALFPIFVVGFSMISFKLKHNTSIKNKLDEQFKNYLSGSKLSCDKTEEQFPDTLKQSQQEVQKLRAIIQLNTSVSQSMKERVVDQLSQSYDKDMNYFGTMQYYFFVDKFQKIQNKVLIIANQEIKTLKESNKALEDGKVKQQQTIENLLDRVEALEKKGQW